MTSPHPSPIEGNPFRVTEGVIASFAYEQPSDDELYRRLFASNQPLALWLRRRAAELTPDDLEGRRVLSKLALELSGMLGAQRAADELELHFAPPADMVAPVQITQPPRPPQEDIGHSPAA